MCGIAGFWSFGGGRDAEMGTLAAAMAAPLEHRGPDDAGTWCDADSGVAMSFRRLSIIDLSAAGHQPMVSASGRYVLAFNGEVYNFASLRDELERKGSAPQWRGHSDTEVLVACIEAWGVTRTLEKAVGMFAFALWDRHERRLTLARDRAGEKPLYYATISGSFVFGSELRALEAHPSFVRRIDPAAAALYARFGYVPAPHAIYAGAHKLLPGALLTVDGAGNVSESLYWDVSSVAVACAADRFRGSDEEATDALESTLADSVALRTISDVPLGVFLSGGVDSSLVAALMRRHTTKAVKTFTIGFDDPRFNEAPWAAQVARHLGTDHHETYITAAEALDLLPSVIDSFDEPFADSSAIPTYLVARIARRDVTVVLGGDGGDELFAGYHHHFLGRRRDRRVALVPRPLRPLVAAALKQWSRSDRSQRLAEALAASDPIVSYYANVAESVNGTMLPPDRLPPAGLRDATEAIMFLDFSSYLPDDILVKVDRTSMAVSLEVRAPFLDHRVIELAWRLPIGMKVRRDRGKWILRNLLHRHLPDELIDREKQGFGVPLSEWLRGPLREWTESLLEDGVAAPFDSVSVAEDWRALQNGADRGSRLWRVLMFEAWRRRTGAAY